MSKIDVLIGTQPVVIEIQNVSGIGPPQVQSDWTETDNGEPSYIQNKDDFIAQVDQNTTNIETLAPKPLLIQNANLEINGTTYTGNLSANLPASWYSQGASPGDIINNLVNANYEVRVVANEQFFVGRKDTPSTYGVVAVLVGGVEGDSRNLETEGVGTTGTLTLSDLESDSIWQKVRAVINETAPSDGAVLRNIRWKDPDGPTDNDSQPLIVFYSNNMPQPVFTNPLTVTPTVPVDYYLSGIRYFDFGSVFELSFLTDDAMFRNIYLENGLIRITSPALNGNKDFDVDNPFFAFTDTAGVPHFDSTLAVSNLPITLDGLTVQQTLEITAGLRSPIHSTVTDTDSPSNRPVHTVGIISNDTDEFFTDENYRLVLGSNPGAPTGNWNSIAALVNGNSLLFLSDLLYGIDGNYGETVLVGRVGDQVYERFFIKASANSGVLQIFGINDFNDIAPVGTGVLNIELILVDEAITFDLGKAFGDGNGCRNDAGSSGNSVAFTFGTDNTANNQNRYKIRITHRSNGLPLQSIFST